MFTDDDVVQTYMPLDVKVKVKVKLKSMSFVKVDFVYKVPM